MNEETLSHPDWPLKAYKNLEFLNSPAARSIRVECELTEPLARFQREKIRHTVVMFGSARLLPAEKAQLALKQAEEATAQVSAEDPAAQKALRHAQKQLRASRYYEDTRALAKLMTEWSMANIPDPANRFYVCSGGGPGIMEAANRGAHEAGGKSVGLGISLPFEQGVNQYVPPELAFEFHYFFVRKYWFFYLAKALVVFPGGFGTMDELFEMLTLIQTRKTVKYVPIVLYGKDFWNDVFNLEKLVEWGTISEEDLDLFKVVDDVEEARDYLVKELEENYLKPGGGDPRKGRYSPKHPD